jgi:hypothetical protein
VIDIRETRDRLVTATAEDILCTEEAGRLACELPIDYSDGDAVVVYVEELSDHAIEVSDLSEGLRLALGAAHGTGGEVAEAAVEICRVAGLQFRGGRICAQGSPRDTPDLVWRVATASASLVDIQNRPQQRKRRRAKETFTDEVARQLSASSVDVAREETFAGASGHLHRATLFLPTADLVVEPLPAGGAWGAAAPVYVKFADLSHQNGHRFTAVIDDRDETPADDTIGLLAQVSNVVLWREAPSWISGLRG